MARKWCNFRILVKNPLVSVIIVNWNGAKYLPACFAALMQQTYLHLEIILVDNASSDNSCQVISEFQAQHPKLLQTQVSVPSILESNICSRSLKLLKNTINEGFCRANNQGIQHSRGEFVLLLNADVTPEPRFIETLVKVMQTDSTIGITLGKLLSGHDTTKLDSTGIVIFKTRRAVDRGQREQDSNQYATVEEVFGASGAACLYRRKMLEDIKYTRENGAKTPPETVPDREHDEYLDNLFFAYKEDVDLSWRARLCGWKCVYTPDAVAHHFRNWGLGKRSMIPKWVRRHSLKNRYIMLCKNERWDTLYPHLFHIIWYEIQSLLYILVREPYLLLVFKDLVRLWPNILKKRRLTQNRSRQRVSAHDLLSWFE